MPAKLKSAPAAKKAKAAAAPMSLAEVMAALEKAGSAQTKKTYLRHGAEEPMFGVSFATLKTLYKRIGIDHKLALALWDTGNFDARNLAVKVVDPAQMSAADLDKWAKSHTARMCHSYVSHLAAEGPHGRAKSEAWLSSANEGLQCAGWGLVAAMAMRDEALPDSWFTGRLAEIERSIRTASNEMRERMNYALIAIGCRNASLRKAATASSKKIGRVEIDHGDTACKTPDAAEYISKTWAHSLSKKFESPAAHERSRESMRTRC
jgi:3-methyladenine DNA glycosylase AlkD